MEGENLILKLSNNKQYIKKCKIIQKQRKKEKYIKTCAHMSCLDWLQSELIFLLVSRLTKTYINNL